MDPKILSRKNERANRFKKPKTNKVDLFEMVTKNKKHGNKVF